MGNNKQTALKSNTDFANAAIATLRFMIPIVAIRIGVYIFVFLKTGSSEYILPENFSTGQFAVLFIHQFFGLIAGISFIIWITRAYRNLHACQIENLAFSPKTALWIWIVPILNVFALFYFLSAVYKKTLSQTDSKNEKSFIGLLALFYFCGNFLMMAGDYKINKPATSFQPIQLGIGFGIAGSICMCIAIYLTIRLIKTIAARESTIFNYYQSEFATK